MQLFAVSAPGLETFTAQELRRLALLSGGADASSSPAKSEEDESGGVAFEGGLSAVYAANLHLRTASRVLVRLGEFYAAAFSELRKKASRLPWERYLRPGQPVALRVTCHKSRLYHSEAVAERVAGAIGDHLGKPAPRLKFDDKAEPPLPQLVTVRLVNDQCTISIDSSGALLHRRGYRLASAKAPLRETLAAGILMASGWDQASPLLDPFCGSGTIPIEAALMAYGIPPGWGRRFAFMDWSGFDAAAWEALRKQAGDEMQERGGRLAGDLRIAGSDRDAGAVEMARANAQRAGVSGYIDFSQRAVSAIEPADVGWMVTNPPYGLRVSASQDLRNLYAQFGKVLRSKCPGWRVAVLCSDVQLLGHSGLQLDTSLSLVNGGVAVKLGRGVVAGS